MNLAKQSNELAFEQAHLDQTLDLLKQRETELSADIKSAKTDAKQINEHFFDDVKLDFDGYSTSMDTALSIHQQQQLLNERENAWQHSARQLSTIKRLEQRPFFARIDFQEKNEAPETIYIGLGTFADHDNHYLIYDWRAPICSVYYDGQLGKVSYNAPDGVQSVELLKKRQFMIDQQKIVNMFDTDESIGDQMLLEVLGEKSSTKMKSIVTTIQREQNKIIRNTHDDLLFVQGAAGSGKTSAILQRVAYLLYRYRGNLTSSNVIMFSPNQLFNDYIRNVLPEMGEQNMVQMTYWQFISRRVPNLAVSTLFDQFENQTENQSITNFKNSLTFFKLLTKYAKKLNRAGVLFKNIYFKEQNKPYFDKDKIKEIYYSFNENYGLANRIDATREELVQALNHKIEPEIKKAWVAQTLESLSQEQLNALYDRPDQEFESEKKETHFLGRKIVIKELRKVLNQINRNRFLNIRGQYVSFLRAVPKMVDLDKFGISDDQWTQEIEQVIANFKQRQITMDDASAYLYLYDLVTGRRTNLEMRYAFVDEIQDYTPFQVAYLKYNFPRAKFTMLGDLNQAIFTRDQSHSLLKQISSLFDPDSTEVVQLTKSYRSTKQLTDFTKQILRQGEKIESFDRQGPKPVIWQSKNAAEELATLIKVIKENDQQRLTTAIITKDLAQSRYVHEQLKEQGVKTSLIATANQSLVPGTLVLPSYLAKGLEFDSVVMWNASADEYDQIEQAQLVYTITSRAMYKLDIIYTGQLTQLLDVDQSTYDKK